jgi:hypothetical protein|tara:strand:+ start:439 stop:567 length:129 start_codon:yes stop_codon:yes gene_type:complete
MRLRRLIGLRLLKKALNYTDLMQMQLTPQEVTEAEGLELSTA